MKQLFATDDYVHFFDQNSQYRSGHIKDFILKFAANETRIMFVRTYNDFTIPEACCYPTKEACYAAQIKKHHEEGTHHGRSMYLLR